jgi:galactose mutarotase-like enzyme
MELDTYPFDAAGVKYAIAPDCGCNLMEWSVRGRDILRRPPPGWEPANVHRGFGNPILFPAVGRTWDIRDGHAPVPDRYDLAGHPGSLTMPIHGFVSGALWKKTAEIVCENQADITYYWTPTPQDQRDHYPFEVSLALRFILTDHSVLLVATVKNHGGTPAPFSFGYHPYFMVGDPRAVLIELPCQAEVTLDPRLLIPQGKKARVPGAVSLPQGRPMDRVYCDIVEPREVWIRNLQPGLSLGIEFDRLFECVIVYCPEDARFLCVEPWTRGLGGYALLGSDGWENGGGMPVLPPGASMHLTVRYTLAFDSISRSGALQPPNERNLTP